MGFGAAAGAGRTLGSSPGTGWAVLGEHLDVLPSTSAASHHEFSSASQHHVPMEICSALHREDHPDPPNFRSVKEDEDGSL